MQISRHWRLNATRYRLEGIQYEDGSVSLQKRPQMTPDARETQQAEAVIAEDTARKSKAHAAA